MTKILAEKPDLFTGDPKKYLDFKRDIQLYLLAAGSVLVTVQDKILFAISFLKGDATLWKDDFVRDHLSGTALTPATYTWELFIKDMDSQWLEQDTARSAREELERLWQNKEKAVDFFLKFKHLRTRAGYTDAHHTAQLIEWIERHSNKDIIEKIYASGNIPDTVDAYVKRVTDLDNLTRRYHERISSSRKTAWSPAPVPAAKTPPSTAPNLARNPTPGNPVPMDLGRKEIRDARFKAGQCMECGKPWPCADHMRQRRTAEEPATGEKTRAQKLREARAFLMENAGEDTDLQMIASILEGKDFQ